MNRFFAMCLALAILFTFVLPAQAEEIKLFGFDLHLEEQLSADGDAAAYASLLDNILAPEMARDNERMTNYIAACRRFGGYGKLAEAILCAACIPYGRSPEQCVAELQRKGFKFEHEIYGALPDGVSLFEVSYADDGTAQLLMMREVCMRFSSSVSLYLRTASEPVDMLPMELPDMPDVPMWTPAEELTGGAIAAAHLQFFDEQTQEWLTWDFTSPESYQAP